MLGGDARAWYINEAAQKMLADAEPLALEDDRLFTRHRHENAQLQKLIGAAISVADNVSDSSVLALTCANGDVPTHALVISVRAAPGAVVFLRRRADFPRPSPGRLRAVYGLTASEAHLAAELAAGKTLDMVARELELSKETIRKHLRRVFAKTGTSRQSELVATLVCGVEALEISPLTS